MIFKIRYLLASGILFASFLLLATLVIYPINSSLLQVWDAQSFLTVNHSHYQSLDGLMIILTLYGREVYWTAIGVLLFLFGGPAGRTAATVIGISILVLVPITLVVKEVVGRVRPVIPPSDFLLAPDTQEAFPSGHATIVAAGSAGLLASYRDSKRKLALAIGSTFEAALVCFSRVYVGGHYPTDVIGGILLGVAVTFGFVSVSSSLENQVLVPISRAFRR